MTDRPYLKYSIADACCLYGDGSNPCTALVHIETAAIYGCFSPLKQYLHIFTAFVIHLRLGIQT